MDQRIVVIGQSHVRALLDGYELLAGSGEADLGRVETSFVVNRPAQTVVSTWVGGRFAKDASKRSLPDVIAAVDPTHVVLAWGGNQMNLRALLASDRPFDVILPATGPASESVEPHEPSDPSVEVIPCSVIDAYVRERFEDNDRLSPLFAECTRRGLRVCLLEPPPPLPEAAVRERLANGPYFAKLLEELEASPTDVPLVPEEVRQRLWALMAGTYRSFAAAHELDVLAPPEDAFDRSGLLGASYWGRDPTHANGAYGAAVLRRVFAWAATESTPLPASGGHR